MTPAIQSLRCRHDRRGGRRGFTLMELLVVVGILAVLFSLLVPVIRRAREESRRVSCMSNLRQISAALHMYANDNDDVFPHASSRGFGPKDADWIYWQKLPVARDVNKSAIARYLEARNESLKAVLRCPSDNPAVRLPSTLGSPGPYEYSYTMNYFMGSDTGVTTVSMGARRRGACVDAARKILVVEESEKSVDDGRWVWPGNVLATWHDYKQNQKDARGNAVYVDGHVDYVTRQAAQDPKTADPRT